MIFNKLDKGESWNDDFELNMILQVRILRILCIIFLDYLDCEVVHYILGLGRICRMVMKSYKIL